MVWGSGRGERERTAAAGGAAGMFGLGQLAIERASEFIPQIPLTKSIFVSSIISSSPPTSTSLFLHLLLIILHS